MEYSVSQMILILIDVLILLLLMPPIETLCIYGSDPECLLPCRCKSDALCDSVTGKCENKKCKTDQFLMDTNPDGGSYWGGIGCQRGNLATGKMTSLSKQCGRNNKDNNAIDGDIDSYSCSVAKSRSTFAWWMVDLQELSVIEKVFLSVKKPNIGNGEFTKYSVWVGNNTNVVEHTLCRNAPSPLVQTDGKMKWNVIKCTKALLGRYVSVRKPSGLMSIYELAVIGYPFSSVQLDRCVKYDNRGSPNLLELNCRTCADGWKEPTCRFPSDSPVTSNASTIEPTDSPVASTIQSSDSDISTIGTMPAKLTTSLSNTDVSQNSTENNQLNSSSDSSISSSQEESNSNESSISESQEEKFSNDSSQEQNTSAENDLNKSLNNSSNESSNESLNDSSNESSSQSQEDHQVSNETSSSQENNLSDNLESQEENISSESSMQSPMETESSESSEEENDSNETSSEETNSLQNYSLPVTNSIETITTLNYSTTFNYSADLLTNPEEPIPISYIIIIILSLVAISSVIIIITLCVKLKYYRSQILRINPGNDRRWSSHLSFISYQMNIPATTSLDGNLGIEGRYEPIQIDDMYLHAAMAPHGRLSFKSDDYGEGEDGYLKPLGKNDIHQYEEPTLKLEPPKDNQEQTSEEHQYSSLSSTKPVDDIDNQVKDFLSGSPETDNYPDWLMTINGDDLIKDVLQGGENIAKETGDGSREQMSSDNNDAGVDVEVREQPKTSESGSSNDYEGYFTSLSAYTNDTYSTIDD